MAACPFCDLATAIDSDLIVYRTPRVFIVPALTRRPNNRGHMLVLPTVHVTRLSELELPLLQELYTVAGRVSMALRKSFGATGTTLFQHEDAPDQKLSHLHIHVVPRRAGDDFKMPDPDRDQWTREERVELAQALRRVLGAP
jgi:histidine triad (HIT) family protein